MKILYVVGHFQRFTGSQRSLCLLIQHLPPEHEPLVVFPGEGRATAEYRARGIPTVVFPAPSGVDVTGGGLLGAGLGRSVLLGVTRLMPYNVRFWWFLRRLRPAIVHFNDSRALLQLGWAARARRLPIVWHLRGENVLDRNRWMNGAARWLSTCVISVAESVAPPPGKNLAVHTIYNGAEPVGNLRSDEAEREASQLLGAAGFDPSQAFRIVTASSLHPYKGLHHVVEALHLLFVARPELRGRLAWFLLADDTDDMARRYRRHLEEISAEKGLAESIIWVGWRANPIEWMSESDVVVQPTVQEELFRFHDGSTQEVRCMDGLPRTILDAMIAGRPIIASKVAGIEELVKEGETGLLVPPGDPQALMSALMALIDNGPLRLRMGESSRAVASFFSISKCVDRTVGVYRDLVTAEPSTVPN